MKIAEEWLTMEDYSVYFAKVIRVPGLGHVHRIPNHDERVLKIKHVWFFPLRRPDVRKWRLTSLVVITWKWPDETWSPSSWVNKEYHRIQPLLQELTASQFRASIRVESHSLSVEASNPTHSISCWTIAVCCLLLPLSSSNQDWSNPQETVHFWTRLQPY